MSWLVDLRCALRSVRRAPGVVSFVVLTLAIGIAGTSSMFALVRAVVLEPLPFADPDALVRIWERRPLQGRESNPVSPADFFDWREQADVFERLAAHSRVGLNLTGDGEPERLLSAGVTDGFFALFGVRPVLGRTFSSREQTPGAHRVVILSHGFWTRRFGSARDILSRTIRLDDVEHEVIGVMPAGFDYPSGLDVWVPLALDLERRSARGSHFLVVEGRLAPGRTVSDARVEMAALASRLAEEFPEVNSGHTVRIAPLQDELLGSVQAALWLLFGVSLFVLVICCANVANIWLARSLSREREYAVAAALGAGKLRLIRPLLMEAALVVIGGGGLGWLASMAAAQPLVDTVMPGVEAAPSIEIAATAGLAAGAAFVLFGLLSVLRTARVELDVALKAPRTVSSGGARALRKGLVVGEVALALSLLIACVLIVKSFDRLSAVEPGFQPRGVLAVGLSLPDSKYPEPWQRVAFFERLLEGLETIPGVTSVGSTTILPLSGPDGGRHFSVEGHPPAAPGEALAARVRWVSPGYFPTMGIPLVRGRPFTARDAVDAPRVVLVNQRFVENYFSSEEVLGARLSVGDELVYEIVGVVGDVRHVALNVEPAPHIYFASSQVSPAFATFVLRTAANPLELVDPVREQVWAVDPEQPLASIDLVETVAQRSLAEPRKLKNAMMIFALLALALAAGGIYSVMSYLVVQRRRDLALRMALGARVRDVVTLVLREGMALVAIGASLALVGTALSAKLVTRFLYEVAPLDVASWFYSLLIVTSAGVLATLVPASRCARIDPTASLREE